MKGARYIAAKAKRKRGIICSSGNPEKKVQVSCFVFLPRKKLYGAACFDLGSWEKFQLSASMCMSPSAEPAEPVAFELDKHLVSISVSVEFYFWPLTER